MRKLVLLVSILSAAACLSGTIFAADWPRFLGPSANGFAPDTRISKDWTANPPKALWSKGRSCEDIDTLLIGFFPEIFIKILRDAE